MSKRRISVGELRLGMYVVELDRPWVGTPFKFQGFGIETEGQIEELRALCSEVFIDPDRETWSPEPRSVSAHGRVSVDRELPAAKKIYRTCERALADLLDLLPLESDIDAGALASATKSMISSIERTPDAMQLLNAVWRNDRYQVARAMDTSILMVTFGNFLKLPAERLEVLGLAGMLLDIGMSALPREAMAALASDDGVDSGLLEAHVMHSVELIRGARGLPRGVDEVVALHHERPDGEGYPHGLSGDQISMDGTIAAIVDTFTRLTTPRADGGHVSPSRALSFLNQQRGHGFDEALVEQFIQCIGVYPVGGAVELNTGEAGVVIAQNAVRRLQPRVLVMLDENGVRKTPQTVLDLMREPLTPSGDPYKIRRALPKDKLPIEPGDFFVDPRASRVPA